jgi:hypothetical protein
VFPIRTIRVVVGRTPVEIIARIGVDGGFGHERAQSGANEAKA